MKQSINWRVFAIVIQLFIVLPMSVAADQNEALTLDDVLLRLRTRQATLTTFIADFKQVQKNELFAEPQISAGTLYFDGLGKLLMQMRQPEPYFILLSNGKMISGAPGSAPRQKSLPGGKSFLQRIVDLGQSVEKMKKKFHIQMNHNPNTNLYGLTLSPLKINRRMPYSEIQAEIDSQIWLPVELKLLEPSGDLVHFAFQFTAINAPLPTDIFEIGFIETHTTSPDDIHESK